MKIPMNSESFRICTMKTILQECWLDINPVRITKKSPKLQENSLFYGSFGENWNFGSYMFLWKPKKKINQNNTSLHPIPTWGLIAPSKNCTVFAQRSKCSRSWLDLQNFLIPKKWLRYCQGIQKLHFGGREKSQENRWKLQNLTDIYWSLFVTMFPHLTRMRKFKMQTWWSGPLKFIFPLRIAAGSPI